MSLREAMLDIATQMEKDEEFEFVDMDDTIPLTTHVAIMMYIKMIRMAVKAAGDTPVTPANPMNQDPIAAEISHRQAIEREKEKMRQERTLQVDQEIGEKMVELVGLQEGEGLCDTVIIPNSMPVGAKMIVMDKVFILERDGKLHYSEWETTSLNKSKETSPSIILG